MSRNRHMSSLRKLGKSKQRRRKSSQSRVEYQALEDRKLLAADVFLDVPTGTFGRGGPATPNQHGAVGPEHIVEVKNGRFQVFDRTTGAQVIDKSINDFWLDPGAVDNPGAGASEEVVGNVANSKVIYDVDTRRWFLASEGTADVITGAPGIQDVMLLAVSRSSNPAQDWSSVSDVYDVDNDPNTALETFRGGIGVFGLTNSGVRLGLDGENVYVGGAFGNYVTVNKFSNLVVPNPTTGIPFFGVIRVPLHGELTFPDTMTQVTTDVFGDSGGAVALTADSNTGNTLDLQFIDPAVPEIIENVSLDVDEYASPLPRVRQLFDPDIELSNGASLLNAQRVGDELWAVQGVNSSFDTAGIRWYRIDLATRTVLESGTIEHPERNYYHPTIAVTSENNFVIGYTSSGLDQFPTMTVSVGYENNGQMIVEDPLDLKDGESGYFDGRGNLWGTHNATVVDPDDPTKVIAFGQWSDVSDNGITQMVGLDLVGHSAFLSGDENDNEIIVRLSATDATQVEVVIDGVVIRTYEEEILYSIQLDGGGGDDTFIVDTTNGEIDFPMGVEFVGDSDDQVELRTAQHTTFDIAIDGSGTAQIGNDFAAICNPIEDDVRIFNLNFEAGSLWFDTTPFDLPGFEDQGYTTFGEAYRGELQRYFDETIAPIFAGSFTMTLDITDDETDSAADATALGFGYEEVDGQNLWVASPWSILTGRGDRNGVGVADGRIDYNLDINAFYAGDRALFLEQLAGGLTRSQFFRVLGMDSNITSHTNFFDPRGIRTDAQVIDTRYIDLNGNPLLTDYDAGDNTFLVDSYVTNANWAGDNSGIFFRGIDDFGAEMLLAVNSNSELIDFDVIASALAGTSRDGDFNDIIEEDRAFLRGMGYELNPIVPPVLTDGFLVSFSGIDELQSGDGDDEFCIRSSNVDFELRGGIGNDTFFVTGLGVGALDLLGQEGDDTYSVVFSPSGVATIIDSIGSEFDQLIGVGTPSDDNFIFDDTGIRANMGQLVYTGLEKVGVDGRDGDDLFDVRAINDGTIEIAGGNGIDTFLINDTAPGMMTMSVVDPTVDPIDQLLIEINGTFTDAYAVDTVENFEFDGQVEVDTSNGVPMNANGLNLIGDGDDSLTLTSILDTGWTVDGDGSGNFAVDTAPGINFFGMTAIVGSQAIDTVLVSNTGTDLAFDSRDGNDSFNINNLGLGVLSVMTGVGLDAATVNRSGGGVNLDTSDGDDMVTIMDLGTGVVDVSTGSGMDTLDLLTVGSGGVAANTGSDDDDINVDNATGVGDIAVKGGDGNDDFEIFNSGLGDILFEGEMGDDTYTLRTIDPTVTVTVDDSVAAEADELIAFGTALDDTLDVTGTGAGLNGGTPWFISGIEAYTIDAQGGNDTVTVDLAGTVADTVTILGGDGDDDMSVSNTGDATLELQGGSGDDNYTVSFGLNTTVVITDSVGSENDTFTGFGTPLNDTLLIDGSTTGVNGGSVTMTGIENLIVDGLGGDDDITINSFTGNTTVRGGDGVDTIGVSGDLIGGTVEGGAGDDIFNVTATGPVSYHGQAGNDVFNVDQSEGGGIYNGGDGDDTFNIMDIQGTSSFLGEAGFDTFIVTNHLPLGATTGLIDIDGGDDRNKLLANGYQTAGNEVIMTENQITGISAIPIQYAASGSFNLGSEIGGIELVGSDLHNDTFDIQGLLAEDSVKVLAGGANDRMVVRAATRGRVLADGQEGSDTYQFAIGSTHNRFLNAKDTGVNGWDRIVASLTENNDNIQLSGEAFTVDTDSFGFNENFEALIVNTRGGNDFVDIRRLSVNFLRVLTGNDSDNVELNNFQGVNKIAIDMGAQDDNLVVDSGNTTGVLDVKGGSGDDTITVADSSFANSFIDGEDGSDLYNIEIADRSQRRIVARDSGAFGTDTMNIFGTVLTDRVKVAVGIVEFASQSVLFDENTEIANIDTGAAGDIVEIYGLSSPNTTISTGENDDLVFVKSTFGMTDKMLNLDLGFGDDSAVVNSTEAGTSTRIWGREGNDAIQVGSTFAANNGDLSQIQGDLVFDGGIGNNRMNLNDVGRMASVNYDIGPGFIRTGAGSPSSTMADISFMNTDTLRLDATPFRNHINVTPSVDTAFSFFGRGGFNTITVDGVGGGSDNFFGEDGVKGTFKFNNGMRDIYFEDFFVMS